MQFGSRFQHVGWPLGEFSPLNRFSSLSLRRYPVRFLRYWFARSLLENLHAKLGRPISVLEIGIDRGQMLAFMAGPHIGGDRFARPDWIGRWDGIDVNVDQSTKDRYSYSELMEADVEKPFVVDEQGYDAVLLLHVLEHLFDPEATLRHVSKALRPGGLLIGGSPTMPAWLAAMHEPYLRCKFRKMLDDVQVHRHLSVITPSRMARFAEQNEFETELLAGTFLCRWSGLSLEDSEWWARANLLWGAMFPSLGGEIYFSLRRGGPGLAPHRRRSVHLRRGRERRGYDADLLNSRLTPPWCRKTGAPWPISRSLRRCTCRNRQASLSAPCRRLRSTAPSDADRRGQR